MANIVNVAVTQEDVWRGIIADTNIIHCLEKASTFFNLPPCEISVFFTNNHAVQNLNRQYRHKNTPTNVLSFPLFPFRNSVLEKTIHVYPLLLGDIVLAYETVVRESKELKISAQHHTIHLIIHGFLHLIGYDHMRDDEAKTMMSLEVDILRTLNISNPYIKKGDDELS